jgi:hypothetical protein
VERLDLAREDTEAWGWVARLRAEDGDYEEVGVVREEALRVACRHCCGEKSGKAETGRGGGRYAAFATNL